MTTVCVAGAFDPFHVGHLAHILRARELGDRLVLILNTDDDVMQKRGFVFQPFGQRFQIMSQLRCVDEVVPCIDEDGTVAKTLRFIRPDIFAKGGDRIAITMPMNEKDACREIGCEIEYGIGDTLGSSTAMLKRIQSYDQELYHKPSGDFQ